MSEPTPEVRKLPEPVLLPFAVPTIWVAWVCGPLQAIVSLLVRPFSESCIGIFFLGHVASAVLSLWLLVLPGPHRARPEFALLLAYVGCAVTFFALWNIESMQILALRILAAAIPVTALVRVVRARARARSLTRPS